VKCVICGKEFIRIGIQKTCSPECSKELERRYMKDWWDESYGDRTSICVVCGKKFESRYGKITCSEECQEKRAKQINQEWYKENYKPKIKKCVICGKEFSGGGRSKVCSDECLDKYNKLYNVEVWKTYSKNKYGKVITRYLINKLKELKGEFTYKGEKYFMVKHGNYGTLDSNLTFNWIYWKSRDSNKMLKMEYVMNKVEDNHCSGIKEIKSITFWDDYDHDIVLEELRY